VTVGVEIGFEVVCSLLLVVSHRSGSSAGGECINMIEYLHPMN